MKKQKIEEKTFLLGFEETINRDTYQQRIIDAAKKQWNDSYFGKSEKKLVKFTLRKLQEYLGIPFVYELEDDMKAYVYMNHKKCFIIQRYDNIFENILCFMGGSFDETSQFADLVIAQNSSAWIRRDETEYGWIPQMAEVPEDKELFFHPDNLENLDKIYFEYEHPMALEYLSLLKNLIGVELDFEIFDYKE